MRDILLLAHGTPNVLGEMAEYLSKVVGGRPMPQHVVEELQHRYAEIGLREEAGAEAPPLTKWTMAQADLLRKRLPGTRVYVAMRNWHPYIADVVAQMKRDGVKAATAVCLAPQTSRTSIGLYRRALAAAVDGAFAVTFVEGWHDEPHLLAAFAERLRAAWAKATAGGAKPTMLFTAHSVPCRTVQGEQPDAYARETKRTAELIAAQVPEIGRWCFAFQSQGVAGGPWIGPSVEETLAMLKREGVADVVIQPVGFLCDHVEVLYDIDVAFQQTAGELGMKLTRAESLNGSAELTEALAAVVLQAESVKPVVLAVEAGNRSAV